MLRILMKNIFKVNLVFSFNTDKWEKIDFIEH